VIDKYRDLALWLTKKSEVLNDKYWSEMMSADQQTVNSKKQDRIRRMQGIAVQARNELKRLRSELARTSVSNMPTGFQSRCSVYFDNWDSFFYYMAKYGSTGNLDDLGSATRHYQAVDKDLHKLNRMLGVYDEEEAVQEVTEEAGEVEEASEVQRAPREKEIIREKEVIIKIRCEYCKRPFDETLDVCPSCGARR